MLLLHEWYDTCWQHVCMCVFIIHVVTLNWTFLYIFTIIDFIKYVLFNNGIACFTTFFSWERWDLARVDAFVPRSLQTDQKNISRKWILIWTVILYLKAILRLSQHANCWICLVFCVTKWQWTIDTNCPHTHYRFKTPFEIFLETKML